MLKRMLAVILLLCTLFFGLYEAVAENDMHYFLDIPFEGTTVENISELLSEKDCQGFVKNPKVWSGTVESFEYLGYDSYIQFDFHGKENMSRVSVSPNTEVWGKDEAYRNLVQKNIQNFIDLDNQLTEMYGEPAVRWFTSGNDKYDFPDAKTAFYPPNGVWDEEHMMFVFENDAWCFRAYSQWGNVRMELWSNAGRVFPKGFSCTLHIRFFEEADTIGIKLIDYPAEMK